MDSLTARLLQSIKSQQEIRHQQLVGAEQNQRDRQQTRAQVVGYGSDGYVRVAVEDGGITKAKSLSSGALPVGSVVSCYRAEGSALYLDSLGAS